MLRKSIKSFCAATLIVALAGCEGGTTEPPPPNVIPPTSQEDAYIQELIQADKNGEKLTGKDRVMLDDYLEAQKAQGGTAPAQ